jgi:hypothetical protein
MIDTLFSLAEAYLFMQLVELVVSQRVSHALTGGGLSSLAPLLLARMHARTSCHKHNHALHTTSNPKPHTVTPSHPPHHTHTHQDAHPRKVPTFAGYASMYRDVRAAVDLCHRDGSLKRHVAADPGKYIHDVSLPALHCVRCVRVCVCVCWCLKRVERRLTTHSRPPTCVLQTRPCCTTPPPPTQNTHTHTCRHTHTHTHTHTRATTRRRTRTSCPCCKCTRPAAASSSSPPIACGTTQRWS